MISMINLKNQKTISKEQNLTELLKIEQIAQQKQLKDLYEKLSRLIDKGTSLENYKNEVLNCETGLTKQSNQAGIDLGKELLVKQKLLKQKEDYYSGLKANIIANSARIKEITKQSIYLKQEIQKQEELYAQLKEQTQKIKVLQSSIAQEIDLVNKQLKIQTQKKLKYVKQPIKTQQSNDSSRKVILLRKIDEMTKINETLNELLKL